MAHKISGVFAANASADTPRTRRTAPSARRPTHAHHAGKIELRKKMLERPHCEVWVHVGGRRLRLATGH